MNEMTVEHDTFKVLDQIIEPADRNDLMQIIIDFDVAEGGLKECCKVEWEMAQVELYLNYKIVWRSAQSIIFWSLITSWLMGD